MRWVVGILFSILQYVYSCDIHLMMDMHSILANCEGFEWDKGNIEKSYKKHNVLPNEAEEIFLDEDILILEDVEHSKQEKRFEAIGKIIEGRILFLAFTVRGDKIRIMETRKLSKTKSFVALGVEQ
mgnify:CR=1 FL=1